MSPIKFNFLFLEYNPCLTHKCEHGADCEFEKGKEGYKCICPPGEWAGTYCEFGNVELSLWSGVLFGDSTKGFLI